VGFESTIPVFERAKAFHALDRAATVIGIAVITEMGCGVMIMNNDTDETWK
jgi:hypothetical protein